MEDYKCTKGRGLLELKEELMNSYASHHSYMHTVFT